jgi:hypothetical protein
VAAGDQVEQAFDLGDGEWDQPGIGGWWLVGPGGQRRRWPVAGGCCGGGDRADGEGGHGQHGVAQQGGVAADLGVVESEVVLAELEVLLDRPAQAGPAIPSNRRDLS